MARLLLLLSAIGSIVSCEVINSLNDSHWVHGVPPSSQHLYESSSNSWSCLNDSSIVLELQQINDGICDCPDGSDEPGTGACGLKGPQFYCRNEPFIPRLISQSKVNDGVCDCCDCSDEMLAPFEPFYRGSSCSSVKEAFDRMVEVELREYREGVDTMKRLYNENKLAPMGKQGPSKDALESEVEKLSKELVNSELVLNQMRARYSEQLKANNPLLHEYESLDVDYIASVVNSTFNEVIGISKAYEDILRILGGLQKTYSRSLNDRAVNENVKKFDFLKSHTLKKLTCDSKVEEEQRLQLLEYFQQELPQMFSESRIDKPSKYIIGKMAFVETLVSSKADNVKVVLGKIKLLNGLLSDIADNYNVNYQDSGVIHAVESYKSWLIRYQTMSVGELLPEPFAEKFAKLKDFVNGNVGKILTADGQDQMAKGNPPDFDGFLQNLKYLMNKIPQFFRPNLKEQIKKHEFNIHRLRNELETKRKEYDAVVSAEAGEDDSDLESLKRLIAAFSATYVLENVVDNYVYEITLDGSIYQSENSSSGKKVKIGNFNSMLLNKEKKQPRYYEYLRSKYADEDDLITELVSESDDSHEQYLFANLHDINSGLELTYTGGDKCWNGPKRAARVIFQCGKNFQITKVYETTKCNYGIELTGPIGCNPNFRPQIDEMSLE